MSRRLRPALLLLFATVLLAACVQTGEGDATVVTATDAACEPAETEFDAGEIIFEVQNEGDKVTELYVYGEHDRVISEVENVDPGESKRLTVDLKAGDYELACKPGMTGDGIRAEFTVTGEGGDVGAAIDSDRDAEVRTVDYSFQLTDPKVKAGEAIKFQLINDGKLPHEFEVFGPDGKVLGEIEEVEAGGRGEATFEFKNAGTYRYECHVGDGTADDHFEKGMKGELVVTTG